LGGDLTVSQGSGDVFLDEYTRPESVGRYVRRTAGTGIAYVLENVYGRIYADVIQRMCQNAVIQNGFRVLEYGCGGGMNLLWIVKLLSQRGITLDCAYGTDFSPQMVDAANREADNWAPTSLRKRIAYFAGRNEQLVEDLATGLTKPRAELANSFHLIVGVNSFRYCHRLRKTQECARNISELLAPGGYSIMIDMNHRFPLFRSRFRDSLTKSPEQRFLPTLEEYIAPFEGVGLLIEDARNFCWTPHSAGGLLLLLTRFFAPVLDGLVPKFAMRSLVVSRKSN
jgi:SAM-dependent methyltransferase